VITIPTGDLTGILNDVIPFAWKDGDLPDVNCVRLEWDGFQLHALATDRYRLGWSTWDPTDEPEEEHQDDLFTHWGSGDEPWAVAISLDDAKDLAAHYKLGPKERMVPLTIERDGDRLKVARSRDTGYSAITTVMRDTFAEFPDLRQLLKDAAAVERVSGLSFNAKYLADFAKVRPRGPLDMAFTGAGKLVHVTIGSRFTGAIMSIADKASQ
jgi:hypothetical protein